MRARVVRSNVDPSRRGNQDWAPGGVDELASLGSEASWFMFPSIVPPDDQQLGGFTCISQDPEGVSGDGEVIDQHLGKPGGPALESI